jgi:hypothetical protein
MCDYNNNRKMVMLKDITSKIRGYLFNVRIGARLNAIYTSN